MSMWFIVVMMMFSNNLAMSHDIPKEASESYTYYENLYAYSNHLATTADVEYYNPNNSSIEWKMNDEFRLIKGDIHLKLNAIGSQTCSGLNLVGREKTNEDMYGESYRIIETFDDVKVTHYIIFREYDDLIFNLIMRIETESEAWETARGISVGDRVSELKKAYPTLTFGDDHYYFSVEDENSAYKGIIFFFENEKVTKIVIEDLLP